MILKKIIRKKRIIYVIGDNKDEVSRFIGLVLKNNLSVFYLRRLPVNLDIFSLLRCDIVVIEDDNKNDVEDIKNYLKPLPCTFVITESVKKNRIKSFLIKFENRWDIIMDYSIAKKLKRKRGRNFLTFAINKKKADFNVTDIYKQENKINFKLNYKGKIIPFWVEKRLSKKEVYFMLSAISVAQLMDLNLAEISYKIKRKWPFNGEK